jgi:hypothetical protein
MQRADAANALAAMAGQDFEDFSFAARRVEPRPHKSDIASEIGDALSAPRHLRLLSKWEPRHNAFGHSDKKRGEGWLGQMA